MSMPICSLLCAYVKHGYLAFVDSLLRKDGADVNMKDQAGFVSIHHAVMQGHLEMVKLLINNNADINIDSASGMTAIMLAVDMGHEDIVKTLCEYKPDLLDMYYDVGDTMVVPEFSCQSLNYGLLWHQRARQSLLCFRALSARVFLTDVSQSRSSELLRMVTRASSIFF